MGVSFAASHLNSIHSAPASATTATLVRRLHRLDLLAARLAARKAQIIQHIAHSPASTQTPEDDAQLHVDLSQLYDLQQNVSAVHARSTSSARPVAIGTRCPQCSTCPRCPGDIPRLQNP